ncbi:LytTR family transcriptional regulator [Sphingobacterium phlebotomi]|uniref:LytTR family transcriptional regulator n=1 Tax=Sphingobacterium phlebotomi TaxID=2605433 RepID=A0A5D4H8G2_9SPHI|nr:LytTR family transcriptional regulator [Sphingobacterium phlebotomi]
MGIERLFIKEIETGYTVCLDNCKNGKRLKVICGKSIFLLEPIHIAVAYIVNGWVVIKDTSNKELLTVYTLNELEIILNKDCFFRINRQLIAARSSCISYTPIGFGKLEVGLKVNVPVKTVVSQTKAKTFRKWVSY